MTSGEDLKTLSFPHAIGSALPRRKPTGIRLLSGRHILRDERTQKVTAMATERAACSHIEALEAVRPPAERVCDECVTIGSRWVHLRTCQTCGGTRCCDSSPHRHASTHARSSGHPVVASAEEGERWLYCYPDDAFAEY
jgi:uncharacterized UBP type Zn finger protein